MEHGGTGTGKRALDPAMVRKSKQGCVMRRVPSRWVNQGD